MTTRGIDARRAVLDGLPAGVRVRSHNDARWMKRPDGRWDVLSDPGWGPVPTVDLPFHVELEDSLEVLAVWDAQTRRRVALEEAAREVRALAENKENN